MGQQMTFKRYEIKYMLTRQQYQELKSLLHEYAEPDPYPHSSILSLYYDTDDYRLIRRSIERPVYKEKLRLRRYGGDDPKDDIYVELKKKYDGIVYKRRVSMSYTDALHYMGKAYAEPCRGGDYKDRQIMKEIDYAKQIYEGLAPRVLITYERDSYFGKEDHDFRMTFDTDIRYRTDNLSLMDGTDGTDLIDEDQVLLEIKTPGGLPMWMVQFLSEHNIYKTSFSKYGAAYMKEIGGR